MDYLNFFNVIDKRFCIEQKAKYFAGIVRAICDIKIQWIRVIRTMKKICDKYQLCNMRNNLINRANISI